MSNNVTKAVEAIYKMDNDELNQVIEAIKLKRQYLARQVDFLVMDSHTHVAATDLLLRGIHTTQSDYCTLQFECARDMTYGLLLLGSHPLYDLRVLDDES